MHGVKRTRISAEEQAAKRREEADKIKQYRELVEQCLDKRDAKDYTQESLALTTQILDFNPEFYTVWNYRRRILLSLFTSCPASEQFQLLTTDLRLTFSYLQVHPKVYWIWTHRMWCLENVPLGPGQDGDDVEGWKNQTWGRELMIVEKMMEADPRNFHAWNYRRYVLSSLPSSFKPPRTLQSEVKFTTAKIEANFSNFSAWHQRSKVLGKLWQESGQGGKDKEFELVTQALWTDPADQSGWLYHRWLIADGSDRAVLEREIKMIKELLEAEPDAKWPMESLVHYCSLLAKAPDTSDVDRKQLNDSIRGWLQDLERIDPYRKARYHDLLVNLSSSSS